MRARWLWGAALLALVGLAALIHPRPRAFVERTLRRTARSVAARLEKPRPSKRPTTPEPLSAWVVDDSTKVFPGDVLRSRTGSDLSVELAGARGETVAFQVALAARAGRPRVSAEIPHLEGPGGRIPRERIDAFLESFIFCPQTPGPVLRAGEYPDALIPLPASFSVPPERNQPVWLDVTIPREAAPGRYTGELRFVSDRSEAVRLALTLDVYPFEIPKTPHLTAWVPLYGGLLANGEALGQMSKEAARDVLWRYFRMAHDHRFVTQIAEEEPRLEWDATNGRLVAADWTEYDARNGPALDGSLFDDGEPPPLWKVGGFMGWGKAFGGNLETDADITPARRRALGEYAVEVERHFRERGWGGPRLFMYLIDEPHFQEHPNAAHLVKAYGDAIHAARTGIRHMVTAPPQESSVPQGAIDIWAASASVYFPRSMSARQRAGDLAWFYQAGEPFLGGGNLNDEALGLRSWGWIAWRYRVDGVFLWVGDFWNADPYRDARARHHDDASLGNGVLFYPGRRLTDIGHPAVSGPVSSIRMKCLRRGLFDYEYFRLLKDLGGDPDPLVSGIVRSALNDGEWDPVWHHPRWHDHGAWSHDPAEWDTARRAVARQILARMGAS